MYLYSVPSFRPFTHTQISWLSQARKVCGEVSSEFLILGAGMNAAFATGRLCDLQTGRMRLLNHKNSNLMVRD